VPRAGRAALAAVAGLLPSSHLRLRLIISPRTLLRWHADLVRQRWAYPRRALERPRPSQSVRALLLEMARDNPGWVRRIHGELTPSSSRNVMLVGGETRDRLPLLGRCNLASQRSPPTAGQGSLEVTPSLLHGSIRRSWARYTADEPILRARRLCIFMHAEERRAPSNPCWHDAPEKRRLLPCRAGSRSARSPVTFTSSPGTRLRSRRSARWAGSGLSRA
jgi:hypothetical protein